MCEVMGQKFDRFVRERSDKGKINRRGEDRALQLEEGENG